MKNYYKVEVTFQEENEVMEIPRMGIMMLAEVFRQIKIGSIYNVVIDGISINPATAEIQALIIGIPLAEGNNELNNL